MNIQPMFMKAKSGGKVYRATKVFQCDKTGVKKVNVVVEDDLRGDYVNTYPFSLLEPATRKEYQKQKLQQALS